MEILNKILQAILYLVIIVIVIVILIETYQEEKEVYDNIQIIEFPVATESSLPVYDYVVRLEQRFYNPNEAIDYVKKETGEEINIVKYSSQGE